MPVRRRHSRPSADLRGPETIDQQIIRPPDLPQGRTMRFSHAANLLSSRDGRGTAQPAKAPKRSEIPRVIRRARARLPDRRAGLGYVTLPVHAELKSAAEPRGGRRRSSPAGGGQDSGEQRRPAAAPGRSTDRAEAGQEQSPRRQFRDRAAGCEVVDLE